MTHPIFQTNGASLEDCHTNFFALTDLCGIKWRRLSAESGFCIDPLDDPVLLSFTKCLAADILCVWRRVQCSKGHPDHIGDHNHPPQVGYNKELWIFWYGEEPDLSNLICPELQEMETGSWDSGLSYECRTLLFKALHNLIERCLISRDFVRLGRWFVQPYDIHEKSGKSPHLTFSFSFFVHGESTVCATVDVRQHPAVYQLSHVYLQHAQASHSGIEVILGPFGLSGILTGQSYKDMDHSTQKLLDDWRQFFPIDPLLNNREGVKEGNALPSLVEVLVGGVRMRYPSCYVLVVEGDDVGLSNPSLPSTSFMSSLPPQSTGMKVCNSSSAITSVAISSVSLTPPTSPCDSNVLALGGGNKPSAGPVYGTGSVSASLTMNCGWLDVYRSEPLSHKITARVWQDGTGGNGTVKSTPSEVTSESDPVGHWDHADPTQKTGCSCSKWKKSKQQANQPKPVVSSANTNSQSGAGGKRGERNDKLEKQQLRHARGITPFHRRSPINDELPVVDMELSSSQRLTVPPNPSYQFKGSSTAAVPTGLPQLRTSLLDPISSGASPHSSAPSPLVASHSQPASVTQTDPTMPTLSPHPPASKENDLPVGEESGPTDTHDLPHSNTVISPLDLNKEGPKSISDQVFSPYSTPLDQNKTSDIINWTQSQGTNTATTESTQGLKRPCLPAKTYEEPMEDDVLSDRLYDYSALDAWLNHPVKKFKLEPKTEMKQCRPGSMSENQPSPMNTGLVKELDSPQSQLSSDNVSSKTADPYEFVEETPAIVNMPGFKSKNETAAKDDEAVKGEAGNGHPTPAASETAPFPAAKESSFSNDSVASPPTPINPSSIKNKLLTSQDLQPTYNDLDQLFDTSDEDCNDDAFQAPTPNGSLKPLGNLGEDGLCGKNKSGDIIGLHGPTDISRMFPTPPSLEHNPTPSPGGPLGGTDTSISESENITVSAKERIEGYPSHCSPMEELITDWSYVFKPPSQAKFVGSSKYAPLTNLPSQNSPPVTLPSHCVYKPWQYPLPIIDKHPPSNHMSNISSVESIDRIHSNISRSMEPSPATFPMGLDHRIPSSYELTSPASNASSYLNKNLNSIDNSGTVSHVPEAHGLLVNIVLSDSMLNLFKDHNFDSCTMCVCQMDINGSDAGLYLPDTSVVNKEASYKCTCGFSAVVNRRHGYQAGLFYEDEVEITGIRGDDSLEKVRKASLISSGDTMLTASKEGVADDDLSKNLEPVPQYLLELLRVQCTTLFSSCNILFKSRLYQDGGANSHLNSLEIVDGCEVVFAAVDQGRQAVDNINTGKLDEMLKMTCLHKWPHLKARLPSNSQDIVRLLRSLQPLLQDAIQKKRTTGLWETTYSVSGPLTWRQFHRLVGRAGTEDQCEPQPIPSLLVGYDKDWLALSPFAVKYWEKLLLEPYSLARDIAYVVVAPDNEFILNNVRSFFKELSGTYEVCRLGRHCPITKVLRDGIIRVGQNSAKTLGKAPVDDWFNVIGESALAAKLKLYAQVCGHHLAPHLAEQLMDRTLLDVPPAVKTQEKPASAASPMPPPTPENTDQVPTPKTVENGDIADTLNQTPSKDQNPAPSTTQDPWEQDDDLQVPAIVIYMIDPFTYGKSQPDMNRLSTLGLLRCFAQVVRCLPEHMQNNVNLQIIPLESILTHTQSCDSSKQLDHLKSLAFSVFSQCRRTLIHQSTVKSLTGFGPAAQADVFLKTKDEKNSAPYRMYSPPYILAPMKDKQTELGESFGDRKEKCTILYCTYCLSEDQRCLLAACTDDRGEIMESVVINIEIPNRNRRKKASARKASLLKLMDWILGVMSMGAMPWRLIIGRLGRLGHGELKGWSSLLSRKYLVRASKHLQDICKQCFYLDTQDAPCILSACLISTEPDMTLRLMPDQFTPDERFGGSCNSCDLSTPQDASCTHILVFPTSATTQSTQATFLPDPGLADDDDILDVLKEDLQEVDAIFDWTDSPVASPTIGSPRKESISLPGSPGLGVSGRQSPFQNVGPTRNSDGLTSDSQEETPQLLQQPLALGYYISTARTGTLPKWFWATCSHLEDACPTFLKSALHIHQASVQSPDDLLQTHSHLRNYHPLDSSLTTDVLRYVLEGYNSLSWLAIDPVSHDRRSCLPVHIQVLMQLHFTLAPLL